MRIRISGENGIAASFEFVFEIGSLEAATIQSAALEFVAKLDRANHETERRPTFSVRLLETGDKKINVIKEIRSITGLGLKEAKDISEAFPCDIATGMSEAAANAAQRALVEAGARVQLLPVGHSLAT